MRTAWIKIDLNRVTLRLWKTQGSWVTGIDLRQWLESRGYTWGGGSWYLCEAEPCDLLPDEITEYQARVTEAGVTFIDSSGPMPSPPAAPAPPIL